MTRYYCNGRVFFKASDAKRYAKERGIECVKGSARRYVANSPKNMEHANY